MPIAEKNGARAEVAQFSFRGPVALHQEVHAAAAAQDMTFAEFARRALADAVANPPSELADRISEIEATLEGWRSPVAAGPMA